MRPIIVKLARMLTDCMDVKLGLVRMDESRWEYKMLDALLTDEMAGLMLTMGRRKPTTAAELAQKTGREEARIQELLDELSEIGLVEYNRRSSDRHKQYVVPIFVVGSAENLVLNKPLLAGQCGDPGGQAGRTQLPFLRRELCGSEPLHRLRHLHHPLPVRRDPAGAQPPGVRRLLQRGRYREKGLAGRRPSGRADRDQKHRKEDRRLTAGS